MKITFFGATNYSLELLECLLKNRFNVSAIFTLPEEFEISYAKGTVKIYNYADLKKVGKKYTIPVIEVRNKIITYYTDIRRFLPDLILVLGWYHMIPNKIRKLPPKGCIGIHASLLPKYAGGAPLVWAIINGENETGVTMFYLDEGVDTGDIIAQERFSIEYNDDISTVYKKATEASKKILLSHLPKIEKGNISATKQNLSQRTIYPQRNPEDGKIDWTKSAEEIRNFIRAQTKPYPGAYSFINGQKIIIWSAEKVKNSKDSLLAPGKIKEIRQDCFTINTDNGLLRVTDYEPKWLSKPGVQKL